MRKGKYTKRGLIGSMLQKKKKDGMFSTMILRKMTLSCGIESIFTDIPKGPFLMNILSKELVASALSSKR
jgi:hypothetical protein